ncbi:MAG: hypothetical protein V2I33_25335 [Kangiellaceae bacterium]|jgi:hypothetical protein|nr:hypothetical protein [Kangiellaceae bacterium]
MKKLLDAIEVETGSPTKKLTDMVKGQMRKESDKLEQIKKNHLAFILRHKDLERRIQHAKKGEFIELNNMSSKEIRHEIIR